MALKLLKIHNACIRWVNNCVYKIAPEVNWFLNVRIKTVCYIVLCPYSSCLYGLNIFSYHLIPKYHLWFSLMIIPLIRLHRSSRVRLMPLPCVFPVSQHFCSLNTQCFNGFPAVYAYIIHIPSEEKHFWWLLYYISKWKPQYNVIVIFSEAYFKKHK